MVTKADIVVHDCIVRLLETLERYGIHGADKSDAYKNVIVSIYDLVKDCYGEGQRQS